MPERRKANPVAQSHVRVDHPCEPLLRALKSMRGHATFATLSDVHDCAAASFGFNGTIDEAAELLQQHPELQVETAGSLAGFRIRRGAWTGGSTDPGANRPPVEVINEYPAELLDEAFLQAKRLLENEFRRTNSPQNVDRADE